MTTRKSTNRCTFGFDLAAAAGGGAGVDGGVVVFADYLGIYGNCVIVDHGLGVQSLYAHLFDRRRGGRDGNEGSGARTHRRHRRSGGDHLHFTMLLQGEREPRRVVGSALVAGSRVQKDLEASGSQERRQFHWRGRSVDAAVTVTLMSCGV